MFRSFKLLGISSVVCLAMLAAVNSTIAASKRVRCCPPVMACQQPLPPCCLPQPTCCQPQPRCCLSQSASKVAATLTETIEYCAVEKIFSLDDGEGNITTTYGAGQCTACDPVGYITLGVDNENPPGCANCGADPVNEYCIRFEGEVLSAAQLPASATRKGKPHKNVPKRPVRKLFDKDNLKAKKAGVFEVAEASARRVKFSVRTPAGMKQIVAVVKLFEVTKPVNGQPVHYLDVALGIELDPAGKSGGEPPGSNANKATQLPANTSIIITGQNSLELTIGDVTYLVFTNENLR